MTAQPALVGARVLLRRAQPSDVQDRLANGRHAEINRAYGAMGEELAPLTLQEAEAWVAQMTNDPHAWVIEHDGRCIGGAGLHSINAHDRRASFAIGLQLPELLGRGLGTEVTQLVLTHAFDTMGLHRITVRVLADNARAIRCYEKCGFVVEGRERESARVGDGWQDDLIMGALSSKRPPA